MQRGISENTNLSPLLLAIDVSLVHWEEKRSDSDSLDQLLSDVHAFQEQARSQRLDQIVSITDQFVAIVQRAKNGELQLTSVFFEPLFQSVALIQEQLEEEAMNQTMYSRIEQQFQEILDAPIPKIFSSSDALSPPHSNEQVTLPPSSSLQSIQEIRILDEYQATTEILIQKMQELAEISYAGDGEVMREQIQDCIDLCESVGRKINDSNATQAHQSEEITLESMIEELQMMIGQWAMLQGKKVQLIHHGATLPIPNAFLSIVRKALFQFTQFLIEESLEKPANRVHKGEEGTIYVHISKEEEDVLIAVSDDGKGIELDSLKNKAQQQGIEKKNVLDAMNAQEVYQLLLHKNMFSWEDAEVGSHFPQLKEEIEEHQGRLGIESDPEQMLSFLLSLPIRKKESALLSAVSSLTEDRQFANISPNLESLQLSAKTIQQVVDGIQEIPEQERKVLEQNLGLIFSGMKEVISGISHGDLDSARAATKTLSEIESVDLFKEVGMMAREMHENLKSFSGMIDAQFQNFDLEQIPDASHRLEHIIEITEQSANTTLDFSEALMVDSGEMIADLETLQKLLESSDSSEKSLELIQKMKARELQVSEKLVEIMTAQDFQDRTGQVIKKIIVLVDDLEKRLLELVKTFGNSLMASKLEQNTTTPGAENAENIASSNVGTNSLLENVDTDKVEMYGPQHKEGKGMADQDQVDSLLAQFGF